MNRLNSKKLFAESKELTPGGVSSPVRSFEPYPVFFSEGKGCRITDVDGNGYIDVCMAYGPLILGHAHPSIISAVNDQICKGSVFGAPTEPELELIRTLSKRIPCAEMVRLANSGTEATMHAVRLARGYTGREKIVTMKGGYHGAHDAVLLTSKGVLKDTISRTYAVEYNSEEQMEEVLSKKDIAAVLMEPVLGNTGVVTPNKNYLSNVKKITEEHGTVLIFDEVITGCRLSPGGAQEIYNVTPDICTMAKIIGGGLPAGAIAGKREIMEHFAPKGKVFQAGTFSGNPLTCAAGLAALREMTNERYNELNERSSELVRSLEDSIEDRGIRAYVGHAGSIFQVFFGIDGAENAEQVMKCDRKMFEKMFRGMLDSGIYMPSAAIEINFLSTAHGPEDIKRISESFDSVLRKIK